MNRCKIQSDTCTKYHAKDYCHRHYKQVETHGRVLTDEEVKSHYAKAKGVSTNTGRTHFKKGRIAPMKGRRNPAITGEHNSNWKGDDVGVVALHSWVKRWLGRPKECQNCRLSSDNPNMIQWANKSQQYKRDLSDWLRLCARCHKAYDTGRLKLAEIGA